MCTPCMQWLERWLENRKDETKVVRDLTRKANRQLDPTLVPPNFGVLVSQSPWEVPIYTVRAGSDSGAGGITYQALQELSLVLLRHLYLALAISFMLMSGEDLPEPSDL